MTPLNAPEPPPQRNDQPACWDLVITDASLLPIDAFPARDLAIDDMRARDEQGAAKYGTRLQPHNGRDALVDAYQEALDLSVYLRQSLAERHDGAVWAAYRSALATAADLREIIAARGKR